MDPPARGSQKEEARLGCTHINWDVGMVDEQLQ
jgi:hypothetical protein